jgi:hypothetical protein
MTLFTWSQTAATNATADATINWAEGMAPSAVNNSARAMMAAAAKYRDDQSGNLVTGGTSTAYTLTTNQVHTALTDGIKVTARLSATNGASPTLAVDGLTAKQIRSVSGTNIGTGVMLSGSVWSFVYDSSDDAWIVHSAPGGFTVPLTSLEIAGATALTAPAVDDALPIYDLSATTNKKITTTDLFEVLNAFTEDASPHVSNDFLLSYDASASTVKKVTLSNLVAAFLTAGMTLRNTAKAYANCTISGGSVTYESSTDGFNVSGIVRDSEGDYTVSFTSSLPTDNYSVSVTPMGSGTEVRAVKTHTHAVGSFKIKCTNASSSDSDPDGLNIIVFGY